MNDVVIRYFSSRMFRTLDFDQLFKSLFERFGECPISVIPMTAEERAGASKDINGITAVLERFWIFHRVEGALVRERDLEEAIVRLGRK